MGIKKTDPNFDSCINATSTTQLNETTALASQRETTRETRYPIPSDMMRPAHPEAFGDNKTMIPPDSKPIDFERKMSVCEKDMTSQPHTAPQPSHHEYLEILSHFDVPVRLDLYSIFKIFLPAVLFAPTVCAAGDNNLSVPKPDRACPPTFSFESSFDYVAPGAVVLYLTTVLVLRKIAESYYRRLFRASLGVMLLIGLLNFVLVLNCSEFPSRVRATSLVIWLGATSHVAAQFCHKEEKQIRHLVGFLLLLVIYVIATFTFPSLPLLATFPPYTSVVALLICAINPLQKDHETARYDLPTHTSGYHCAQHGNTTSIGIALTNQSDPSVNDNPRAYLSDS